VANALDRSSFFLVFISARAVESKNVKNEINFAINHHKPFVAIHVEATDLPKGLELRMGDIQAILKYRMNADRFHRQMEKTLPLTLRLDKPVVLPPPQVKAPDTKPKEGFLQRIKNRIATAAAEAEQRKQAAANAQRKEVDRLLALSPDELSALRQRIAPEDAGDRCAVDLGKGVSLDLVWCPPGTFWMGSPENELGHRDHEVRHRVTLTKGFWIGKFPVTQEQWEFLMGNNPSRFIAVGKNAPVESVMWDDCQNFRTKLQPLAARGIPQAHPRLPTEAEWEYACRAGTVTTLNSGKDLTSAYDACANLDAVGWYGKNSGSSTHAVGQKAPNAWGIFDMHGNVSEWCADWFGEYPSGEVTDPTGPSSGLIRVVRGGTWGDNARFCRAAYRTGLEPHDRYSYVGFRVVVR
jgi:formylglycine-generating enzyme required for sulfatase activity